MGAVAALLARANGLPGMGRIGPRAIPPVEGMAEGEPRPLGAGNSFRFRELGTGAKGNLRWLAC
jgi:hypothetical protein